MNAVDRLVRVFTAWRERHPDGCDCGTPSCPERNGHVQWARELTKAMSRTDALRRVDTSGGSDG